MAIEYVPSELIDPCVGNKKGPRSIVYSKECPSGYKEAVVRLITFNLFADGVEVFDSSQHGTVYAVTVAVNNSLNKFRNTPAQTCLLVTIPSSEGSKSNPIFRSTLGEIEKSINEEGKKGFFIQDLDEGVLYHYYYGIHCHCFDLIAAMQFYDRPSCGTSSIPCFQHNCAVGVYNPVLKRYSYPEMNYSAGTTSMKCTGRFSTHFPEGSICRTVPFIVALANKTLYSSRYSDVECVIDMVEKYLQESLSLSDKVFVKDIFNFIKSFGNDFFLHTPVESGNHERRVYEKVIDDEESKFEDRTNLVSFTDTSPLPADAAYVFDLMHGVANAVKRVVSYVLGNHKERNKHNKRLKQEVLKYLNDGKDVSMLIPFFHSLPDSVVTLAIDYISKENKLKKDSLVSINNLFVKDNFSSLKCHDKMLFAFQIMPTVFSDSLHIPLVRLFIYAFQIVAELYNIDADMCRVSTLQNQLLIVLSLIEGLVHDRFMTLSFHMLSHLQQWIVDAGPLKNSDTFYTEHSYRLYNDLRLNSRNVIKTLGLRMFMMTYCSIRTYFYCMEEEHTEHYKDNTLDSKHIFFFTDWPELTRNGYYLLMFLTKGNFQDDYIYSRFDVIGHTTILDCFCNNGFCIDNLNYRVDLYFDSNIWNNVEWNCRVYSQIHYHGRIFYSHSYKRVVTKEYFIKNSRVIAFNRGFKQQLRVFVMLGFIRIKINGFPYVQAICYTPETVKPLNITSPLITAIRVSDLLTLNTKRLCLVSCDCIIANKGRFCHVPNDDYVLFKTNSNYVKQSSLITFSEIFDSIPVKQ